MFSYTTEINAPLSTALSCKFYGAAQAGLSAILTAEMFWQSLSQLKWKPIPRGYYLIFGEV